MLPMGILERKKRGLARAGETCIQTGQSQSVLSRVYLDRLITNVRSQGSRVKNKSFLFW